MSNANNAACTLFSLRTAEWLDTIGTGMAYQILRNAANHALLDSWTYHHSFLSEIRLFIRVCYIRNPREHAD